MKKSKRNIQKCIINVKRCNMNRLKELRKEKKLTQIQLSKLCGIPQNQISRFERGTKLNEDEIKILCKFFDVTADYFLMIENEAKL
jgi:transcriptional regulator with XRE-family HTH domain